jgi:hypothetical protein
MTPGRGRCRHDDEIVLAWQGKVSEAALPFEARWTEAALRRIDPGLDARFHWQREPFNCDDRHGPKPVCSGSHADEIAALIEVDAQ